MKSNSTAEDQGLYSQVTSDIKVTVLPAPIVDESQPDHGIFSFSYTITIENLGSETVQLLERHWVITSDGVQIAEVVGPGVVGKQPVLAPGASHIYTSGAVIHDPIGSMQGSYTFRTTDGRFFQVEIPKFDLVFPLMIH